LIRGLVPQRLVGGRRLFASEFLRGIAHRFGQVLNLALSIFLSAFFDLLGLGLVGLGTLMGLWS
jgi:hypothetical protein